MGDSSQCDLENQQLDLSTYAWHSQIVFPELCVPRVGIDVALYNKSRSLSQTEMQAKVCAGHATPHVIPCRNGTATVKGVAIDHGLFCKVGWATMLTSQVCRQPRITPFVSAKTSRHSR